MGRFIKEGAYLGCILYLILFNILTTNAQVQPTNKQQQINLEPGKHYSVYVGKAPHEEVFALASPNITNSCKLKPADDTINKNIQNLLSAYLKLLEYQIKIVNHTDNPLLHGRKWTYKLDNWARVSHSHGRTILSLAFNYGVLSLMTLTFGVATMEVNLVEEPYGCLLNLTEEQKVELLLYLLLRDFRTIGSPVAFEGHTVCHQVGLNLI